MGQAKIAAMITLAVSLVAGPAIAAEPLRLVWADSTGAIADREATLVRAEVVRVLDVIGLRAGWVADPTDEAEIKAVHYVVVSSRKGAAGFCTGGHTIWLNTESVRLALGSTRLHNGTPASLYLTTAFARTIAHELLHSLVPGFGHGSTGLMTARMDPEDIASPVSLDGDWKDALSAL